MGFTASGADVSNAAAQSWSSSSSEKVTWERDPQYPDLLEDGYSKDRSIPDYVVNSDGFCTPILNGVKYVAISESGGLFYSGGMGLTYNDGESDKPARLFDKRVYAQRIEDPITNSPHPQGYRSIFMNASNQTVNPFNGRTIDGDHDLAHLYHDARESKHLPWFEKHLKKV